MPSKKFQIEYNYDIIWIGCDKVRVIISAGGTGGHIYPALAVINKIKTEEPDSEFLYIGTHNRMEKDIIPNHKIPFKTIEIYGFNRTKLLKNVKTVKSLFKSYYECKKIIKDFKPDIVIGMGGYVTVPVLLAAKKLGFKTFIHEQNSVPGKANLYLSKHVTSIGVSMKSSIKHFPEYKTVFTGNPCSEEALLKPELDKRKLGLNPNKKLVLFVMGSLGSEKINKFLIKTMSLFNNADYEILYITGKDEYPKIVQNKFPKNVITVPYLDNMVRIMKKTDVIVSRAGATTISEIIALKIPSILIPSPYVPDNHQYKNAMDLVNKKAAVLINEKDLKGDILAKEINELLNDPKKIETIKENLSSLGVSNSAALIYETIKKSIDRK